MVENHIDGAKMRFHIEFQYAESFHFLTLFKMFERERDAAAGKTSSMFYTIQY